MNSWWRLAWAHSTSCLIVICWTEQPLPPQQGWKASCWWCSNTDSWGHPPACIIRERLSLSAGPGTEVGPHHQTRCEIAKAKCFCFISMELGLSPNYHVIQRQTTETAQCNVVSRACFIKLCEAWIRLSFILKVQWLNLSKSVVANLKQQASSLIKNTTINKWAWFCSRSLPVKRMIFLPLFPVSTVLIQYSTATTIIYCCIICHNKHLFVDLHVTFWVQTPTNSDWMCY